MVKNRGKISIIGAGNVATAFARALHNRGYSILKIISRSGKSASGLASLCGSESGSDYIIPNGTELVIISVPDHELPEVTLQIKAGNDVMVVHTAGSFGTDVFPDNRNYRCGVLYPLQTFSKGRDPGLEKVPLFVEAESPPDLDYLIQVASTLSDRVLVVDIETRRRLHLAAVFASNFVNHMLSSAETIIAESDIDFDVFEPLVRETLEKAFRLGPSESQTGPAVRNDLNTIEKHLDLLSFSHQLREVYITVTESIIKKHSR
ncbi:MAG: DUF2520 domain-containing protein [Bacteroidia bacterium]|nr:MAG: DUF2520 domain-containing protein [Bacteroidia bacterium]